IRFGLHDNNGSAVTTETIGEGWTARTADWDSYCLRGGVGDAPSMRIYRDLPGRGDAAMGGSGDETVGNGTGWALADETPHAVRLEAERQANGQQVLRFYLDDELLQESSTTIVGGAQERFTNFTIG